jgi:membrane protein
MVNPLKRILGRVDAFQERHAALAFPVAVWKKLGDDQAGNLAALLTFYAFVSLFPLLLVLTTTLGIVLRHDPALQKRVLDSALTDFPVIGPQLRSNVQTIGRGSGSLVVGAIGTLLGARGLANAAQSTLNQLWGVPYFRRSGFPFNWLRSYGMIAVIGLGVLTTTAVTGIGTWAGGGTFGIGLRVLLIGASLVANMGLFWLGLRLATAREVAGRNLRLGAILGAVIWQVLQWVGGLIVAHQLRHASSLYGVFGLVLGLIAWLYLQARLTLFAVQTDVVRTRHLWPRSLFPPPLTPEDRVAYRSYTEMERRRPPETAA